MARINVPLTDAEAQAIITLARAEFRHPRQQAALLIRLELERRGLLVTQNASSDPGKDVGTGSVAIEAKGVNTNAVN